jgi:hypothetical protein
VEAEGEEAPLETDCSDASQSIDEGQGQGQGQGLGYSYSEGGGQGQDVSTAPAPVSSGGSSSGYSSTPSNLLHPDSGGDILLGAGGGGTLPPSYPPPPPAPGSALASADGSTNSAIRMRVGLGMLPSGGQGAGHGIETETEGGDADMDVDSATGLPHSAEAAYRRLAERVCRVQGDAAFSRQHRGEMDRLREANARRPSGGRLLRPTPGRGSGGGSSGGGDLFGGQFSVGFSHTKKLVSVRRLRVVTIAVECSSKVPRLLAGTRAETLAVLVAREALFNVKVDYRTDALNGGAVRLIGGLYEWCKKLTLCAARAYLSSKLARKYGPAQGRQGQGVHKKSSEEAGPGQEEYQSLVNEAVDLALKDAATQSTLLAIFGCMARVIGGHAEEEHAALTIGVCIQRYLGGDSSSSSGGGGGGGGGGVPEGEGEGESAIPARRGGRGRGDRDRDRGQGRRALGPPTFSFSDSFAEVLMHVCIHVVTCVVCVI